MPERTRRELTLGLGAIAATSLVPVTVSAASTCYRSFRPGEAWLDTSGKPIQAHAGSLIVAGSTYYWYGENKEFMTDDKASPRSWGVRFYRSKDLYNWEDLGAIVPPDQARDDSPLNPKLYAERPHILYNPKTRKFVCWIKIRGRGPEYRTVLTADAITGPYTMVHEKLNPLGMAAGDFDLVADADTGKAYMYFEHDHKELVCVELTEDWCNVSQTYTMHFPRTPPHTKEGIACFRRKGKLYVTSSGMTGYFPNPSAVEVADTYHGPFTDLGDLHPSDRTRTSFNSQISCIFKHPHRRDRYIARADRWYPQLSGPDFESGALSENVRSGIGKVMNKPPLAPTPGEVKALQYLGGLKVVDANTSGARYIWLPITFEGDRPVINWNAEWRVEDFPHQQ